MVLSIKIDDIYHQINLLFILEAFTKKERRLFGVFLLTNWFRTVNNTRLWQLSFEPIEEQTQILKNRRWNMKMTSKIYMFQFFGELYWKLYQFQKDCDHNA